MQVGFKLKSLFFDSPAVINAVNAVTRKALSRAGAFIRTRARSSMRRRKGAAKPGMPPYVHAGDLKDKLFFSYDPVRKSVVVGPIRFSKGIADVLEEGGDSTVVRHGKTVKIQVAPHPYMGPALAKEIEAGTIPREFGING